MSYTTFVTLTCAIMGVVPHRNYTTARTEVNYYFSHVPLQIEMQYYNNISNPINSISIEIGRLFLTVNACNTVG